MQPVKIATWSEVADRSPVGALVDGVDPVIVRFADNHSVLYGRCLHRGAHMADGHVDGDELMVGAEEARARIKENPQPYDCEAYQGSYQYPHGDSAEPHVGLIRRLANGRTGPRRSDVTVYLPLTRHVAPGWKALREVFIANFEPT